MIADPSQQPPTKANLKAWWNHFTFVQKVKKESDVKGMSLRLKHFHHLNFSDHTHVVFGKPLIESLKYASVQISTANANGELYVWGYIPVVVAKWCVTIPRLGPC